MIPATTTVREISSLYAAMAAKWRYGTPVLMSEHGIYLRERYLSSLTDRTPHAVKVLVLSFFRMLAGASAGSQSRKPQVA